MGKMAPIGKLQNNRYSLFCICYALQKVIVLFCLLIGIYSCKDERTEASKEKDKSTTTAQVKVPSFNEDSAYVFIQRQVAYGPRVPNTKSHDECALFLESVLKSYTPMVTVQKAEVIAFDGKKLKIKNFIASFNPNTKNRIALFAHWDTRPFADQDIKNQDKPIDGANDGGSGVGVLLEIARVLASHPPSIGVDIILFDAEDYGQPDNSKFPEMQESYCLGSKYWSQHKHDPAYFAKYGILLDMVGAKNAQFTMEGESIKFAEDIVKKVWKTAAQAGYSDYFIYTKTKSIIDDHYYINTYAQIPTIDIIQYDPQTPSNFTPSWHTHNDNMSIIDKNTLKAVGQTLVELIYREK